MGISETKKQIVIDNYFKNTCDINTSVKEAFTKGFEVGLTKAVFPKDQYEARLKADMVAILDKIRAEIESQRKEVADKHTENDELQAYYDGLNDGLKDARDIHDKHKAESEG